mmetsp:Transcript_25187/g.70447  ORF Transcript_25187/g.70447 Transcript_25187/m.70447 type:complete len:230 (-) Transcript_25187:542-1231(-)
MVSSSRRGLLFLEEPSDAKMLSRLGAAEAGGVTLEGRRVREGSRLCSVVSAAARLQGHQPALPAPPRAPDRCAPSSSRFAEAPPPEEDLDERYAEPLGAAAGRPIWELVPALPVYQASRPSPEPKAMPLVRASCSLRRRVRPRSLCSSSGSSSLSKVRRPGTNPSMQWQPVMLVSARMPQYATRTSGNHLLNSLPSSGMRSIAAIFLANVVAWDSPSVGSSTWMMCIKL